MAGPPYPRHLHKPDGSTCLVVNDDEKFTQLAAGWNLWPGPTPEPVAPVADEPTEAPKARGRKAKGTDAG